MIKRQKKSTHTEQLTITFAVVGPELAGNSITAVSQLKNFICFSGSMHPDIRWVVNFFLMPWKQREKMLLNSIFPLALLQGR
jgi:hypothetical protein